MTYQEIVENLCTYDPRNPLFSQIHADDLAPIPAPRDNCYCDNCFKGRDRLALELLEYLNLETRKLAPEWAVGWMRGTDWGKKKQAWISCQYPYIFKTDVDLYPKQEGPIFVPLRK